MEPWDHLEPWDAGHRLAEECIELAKRLHMRHAERWRRLLARMQADDKADQTALGATSRPTTTHDATRSTEQGSDEA